MTATTLRADSDPAAVVAELDGRARRFATPCGDGSMVWRDGPPVLLAHGSHGSWLHWIRNIDALAAERTVWAPDLPGFGESAMPPQQDHDAISAVIAEGLGRLVAPALPIDVIGFSYGGVVAAHLAARRPELVRRLVLVDTGGLDTPMGHLALRGFRKLAGEERRAALRNNLLALMIHDPANIDALALHLQEVDSLRARMNPTPLVLPARLIDALPKITAQLSAIWAEYDQPHPDPAVQAAVLRQYCPEIAFRVIPGAGHWVMYEQAEAFNRVAAELLARPLVG
jgi:pimeloyl-ACP methyl ester carboxylesterase